MIEYRYEANWIRVWFNKQLVAFTPVHDMDLTDVMGLVYSNLNLR